MVMSELINTIWPWVCVQSEPRQTELPWVLECLCCQVICNSTHLPCTISYLCFPCKNPIHYFPNLLRKYVSKTTLCVGPGIGANRRVSCINLSIEWTCTSTKGCDKPYSALLQRECRYLWTDLILSLACLVNPKLGVLIPRNTSQKLAVKTPTYKLGYDQLEYLYALSCDRHTRHRAKWKCAPI